MGRFNKSVIFLTILPIIGFIMIFYGEKLRFDMENNNYIDTLANVVDYKYNSNGDTAMVVEYVANGERNEITLDYQKTSTHSIGSYMTIKYNPENPEEVIWDNKILDEVLIYIGIFFVGFSCLLGRRILFGGIMQKIKSVTSNIIGHNGKNKSSRFDYNNQVNQNTSNNFEQNNNNF